MFWSKLVSQSGQVFLLARFSDVMGTFQLAAQLDQHGLGDYLKPAETTKPVNTLKKIKVLKEVMP